MKNIIYYDRDPEGSRKHERRIEKIKSDLESKYNTKKSYNLTEKIWRSLKAKEEDWEKYDVSMFVDPGCIPPDEGSFSVEIDRKALKYQTIQKDLKRRLLTY